MYIIHGFTGSIASTLANKFGIAWRSDPRVTEIRAVKTMSSFRIGARCDSFDYYYSDQDEWTDYSKSYVQGERRVLHIDLAKWADALVIAPLTANTLAKLANGICDNLLTCIARAWDFNKPFVVAPAMNTLMWNHPITAAHINTIESFGIKVIPPISKTLYCGDEGIGAMENIDKIVEFVLNTSTI